MVYTEAEAVAVEDMPELEQYVLHLLSDLDEKVTAGYNAFDFKTVWRRVHDFCSIDLSAFYLDIRKDALYCDDPTSLRRRAARTVMSHAFDRIVAWLAPICVFTMEEAWLERHGDNGGSIHLQSFPETPSAWRNEALAAEWAKVRKVRRVVTGALEVERREKRIGASLEAAPEVFVADNDLLTAVKNHDLAELFITSHVSLKEGEGPDAAFRLDDVTGVSVNPDKTDTDKCQRCWRYTGDVGENPDHPALCVRCADAVDVIDQHKGAA